MGLADELQRMQFGAQLAESLASIGRSLGEADRRERANTAVSRIYQDAIAAKDPFAMFNEKNRTLVQELLSTKEGEQALGGMQQTAALSSHYQKMQLEGVKAVPYGSDLVNTTGTGKAELLHENVRDPSMTGGINWTVPNPEEKVKHKVPPDEIYTMIGENGQKQQMRRIYTIGKDRGGNVVTGQSGSAMFHVEDSKMGVGGRANEYSDPNAPGKKSLIDINNPVVMADGTTRLDPVSVKDKAMGVRTVTATYNANLAGARALGKKSTSWWENVKIYFGASSPKNIDEMLAKITVDETGNVTYPEGYIGWRQSLPQGDKMGAYIDALVKNKQNLAEINKLESSNATGTTGTKPPPKSGSGDSSNKREPITF